MEEITEWIKAWQHKLQDEEYELIVAHPVDYTALKIQLVLPEHLRMEWSEDVTPGHPLVFEQAQNYR